MPIALCGVLSQWRQSGRSQPERGLGRFSKLFLLVRAFRYTKQSRRDDGPFYASHFGRVFESLSLQVERLSS